MRICRPPPADDPKMPMFRGSVVLVSSFQTAIASSKAAGASGGAMRRRAVRPLRGDIAGARDQRSSHFDACRVCFQLAGRRGVTVLKPLVFGDHLGAKQEDDAGDFEAQQPDNRGRQRAVDDADD